MSDTVLVVKIPKIEYEHLTNEEEFYSLDKSKREWLINKTLNRIAEGTRLPEGYGRLITEAEILKFLKCPKYEKCDWKNCSECNQSHCINLNNVRDLAPVMEEKEKE